MYDKEWPKRLVVFDYLGIFETTKGPVARSDNESTELKVYMGDLLTSQQLQRSAHYHSSFLDANEEIVKQSALTMRVEFFFKSQSELSALVNFMMATQQTSRISTTKISPVMPQSVFSRFNLANKVKNDNILVSAKNIIDVMPSANVCIHYSLKYNSQKTVNQSFAYFSGFLTKAENMGVAEVMIVSGSGDKKAFNAVTCLQMLRDSEKCSTPVDIAIAFNPYFPDPKSRSIEINRLHEKLASGMVSSIYLQFGSDMTLLKEGLTEVQNALDTYEKLDILKRKNPKDIKVIGSVMIPSKVLLARMKFRPWNGVFLSESFLSDVPTAEKIVLEMLATYRSFGVEPLIETAFKTDNDANYVLRLLADRNDTSSDFDAVVSTQVPVQEKMTAAISIPFTEYANDPPRKRKTIL